MTSSLITAFCWLLITNFTDDCLYGLLNHSPTTTRLLDPLRLFLIVYAVHTMGVNSEVAP